MRQRAPAGHARRRWHGDGMSPIIEHPDVQRMLLTMQALTAGRARDLLCLTRRRDRPRARARPATTRASWRTSAPALLTPVAKAYSTDIGVEVASLGVQVHGGMGYIEETGAAQHLSRRPHRRRSTRAPTASRRSTSSPASCRCRAGTRCGPISASCAHTADAVKAANDPAFGATGARLSGGGRQPRRAPPNGCCKEPQSEAALAGATPYLRLFALAAGGCTAGGTGACRGTIGEATVRAARIALARFFAENIAVAAGGWNGGDRGRGRRECANAWPCMAPARCSKGPTGPGLIRRFRYVIGRGWSEFRPTRTAPCSLPAAAVRTTVRYAPCSEKPIKSAGCRHSILPIPPASIT